jgi:hypothetical protein
MDLQQPLHKTAEWAAQSAAAPDTTTAQSLLRGVLGCTSSNHRSGGLRPPVPLHAICAAATTIGPI